MISWMEAKKGFFFALELECIHHNFPSFEDGGPLGKYNYPSPLQDRASEVMCLWWWRWLGAPSVSLCSMVAMKEAESRIMTWFLWEVASCTVLSFRFISCRLSWILNNLSVINFKLYYCTKLYILSRSVAPCIPRLSCNNWRSGKFSCPEITSSGGNLCKCYPWLNFCMDLKDVRA